MNGLRIRRVYAPWTETDGVRILVDRLWPRGVRRAQVDRWEKEIAPSPELREQFHSGALDFAAFSARYERELAENEAAAAFAALCRGLLDAGPVTLLFASRDETRNNAAVLRQYLLNQWNQE